MLNRLVLASLVFVAACTTKDPRYIVVDGKATVKVPVDYMIVSLSISSTAATLAQANGSNKHQVQALFDIFNKYAVADSDFVTKASGTTTYWIEDNTMNRPKQPSITYGGTLLFRTPGRYDQLLRDLTTLNTAEFSVRDVGSYAAESFRQTAYTEAMANARKQADLLLAGTGHTTGRILRILQDAKDRYRDYDDMQIVAKSHRPEVAEARLSVAASPRDTFRRTHFEISTVVTVIYEIE